MKESIASQSAKPYRFTRELSLLTEGAAMHVSGRRERNPGSRVGIRH